MLQRRTLTNSRLLRAVTGFSREEIDRLLPIFGQAYQDAQHTADTQRGPRKRRPGGGRKGQLPTVWDKLIFILVYVHVYPIQEIQGILFGVGQSQASDWAIRLLPILQAALKREVALPARRPATMEDLVVHCPELLFLLAATERTIRRPGDDGRQKAHYSGKKKRHTVKNTVICDQKGRRVLYVGETTRGSMHDKTLAEADARSLRPVRRGDTKSATTSPTTDSPPRPQRRHQSCVNLPAGAKAHGDACARADHAPRDTARVTRLPFPANQL